MLPYEKKLANNKSVCSWTTSLLLIKNWKESRREFLGLKVFDKPKTKLKKHITNLH
jgi:hypothetical protein